MCTTTTTTSALEVKIMESKFSSSFVQTSEKLPGIYSLPSEMIFQRGWFYICLVTNKYVFRKSTYVYVNFFVQQKVRSKKFLHFRL